MGTRPDLDLTPGELELLRAAGKPDLPSRDVTVDDRPRASRDLAPRRRRSDFTRRPALSSTAAEKQAAGSLKKEVLAPFGLGVLVVIAALGVISLMADRSGGSVFTTMLVAALALTGGLLWWTGQILKGATQPAIDQLARGMEEVEDGNYEVRLRRVGASEFSELAEGFNRMATIVSHQRDRLKLLADTDALTDLANHRAFHERLRADLQAAQESNTSLAVLTIDLDRFKRVNDEHGHARGDDVIRALARCGQFTLRRGDVLARIGGDEFAVLLVDVSVEEAEAAVRRLRERFEAQTAPLGVSFSAGIATAARGEAADELLARADAAMYRDKRERAASDRPA
jgi:diguanylate cyclase (GGDEF)-like protein